MTNLHIKFKPLEVLPLNGEECKFGTDSMCFKWEQDKCLITTDNMMRAEWSPKDKELIIFTSDKNKNANEKFFKWMIGRSQLEFIGGGTLHASSILINGQALIFVGPSGVGKTTIHDFAEPESRIDDEFSDCIRDDNGIWNVVDREGKVAPIRAVLFPKQSDRMALETVSCSFSVLKIFSELYRGAWYSDHYDEALNFATDTAITLPTFIMKFYKDKKVIDWLSREFK